MELGLRLSDQFQRAKNLDCRRTSWRRKAFRCTRRPKLSAFLELERAVCIHRVPASQRLRCITRKVEGHCRTLSNLLVKDIHELQKGFDAYRYACFLLEYSQSILQCFFAPVSNLHGGHELLISEVH